MTKDTERRLNMDLDRELLKKAKIKAAEEEKTLRDWVTEAIKEKLEREK